MQAENLLLYTLTAVSVTGRKKILGQKWYHARTGLPGSELPKNWFPQALTTYVNEMELYNLVHGYIPYISSRISYGSDHGHFGPFVFFSKLARKKTEF